MVKTTTRTVAEAATTVKGLTGIDIPDLLNSAMGGSAGSGPAKPVTPERPKRKPDQGSGGAGGAGGTGGSGGTPPKGSGPAPAGGSATSSASASRRASAASTAEAVAAPSPAAAPAPAPEAAREPTPEERFATASEALEAATTRAPAPAANALGGFTSPMPPLPPVTDMRPGDKRRDAARAAAAAVGLDESSTLSASATRLAQELIRIPRIERFRGTRLRDLDRSGPRSLRVLWSAARDELSSRYGDVTIGMLLDAYADRQGGAPGR